MSEPASEEAAIYALRPFGASDFDAARAMLRAGYRETPPAFWDAAFRRLREVPPLPGDAPLGALLEARGRPVGVGLLLPSRRPAEPARLHINACSWVILPEARGLALWAARTGMAEPGAVYTALTPNPPTARLIGRLGFRAVSHQCVLAFTPRVARAAGPRAQVLFGGQALAALRDDPLAPALDDHHRLGCTVTALVGADAPVPMVWRTRLCLRMLPTAELLYTPSTALALAHAGALAGAWLRRGHPLMAIEADEHCVPVFPCTWLFQRRFARGAYDDAGIDHLYSELVYLHR